MATTFVKYPLSQFTEEQRLLSVILSERGSVEVSFIQDAYENRFVSFRCDWDLKSGEEPPELIYQITRGLISSFKGKVAEIAKAEKLLTADKIVITDEISLSKRIGWDGFEIWLHVSFDNAQFSSTIATDPRYQTAERWNRLTKLMEQFYHEGMSPSLILDAVQLRYFDVPSFSLNECGVKVSSVYKDAGIPWVICEYKDNKCSIPAGGINPQVAIRNITQIVEILYLMRTLVHSSETKTEVCKSTGRTTISIIRCSNDKMAMAISSPSFPDVSNTIVFPIEGRVLATTGMWFLDAICKTAMLYEKKFSYATPEELEVIQSLVKDAEGHSHELMMLSALFAEAGHFGGKLKITLPEPIKDVPVVTGQ